MRFTNESSSYHDFGEGMIASRNNRPDATGWLLCDHAALRKYGLGRVRPSPVPIGGHLRSGYLRKGRTIGDLAGEIGVPAAELENTIARYNETARRGEDPDFGRGDSAYSRFLGDAESPFNPCVGPIDKGPFYAIKLVMGDLGTFAGLATDGRARVLDAENRPVKGLYAVGNDAASVLGGSYPGAGATLGPALTFGYVAGQDLAKAANHSPVETNGDKRELGRNAK